MDTFNQLCLILNVIINFRYINHEIEKHLQEHAEAQKLRDSPDLLFRPFLRWLDRNLENLFTKALKQVNPLILSQHTLPQIFLCSPLLTKFSFSTPLSNNPLFLVRKIFNIPHPSISKPSNQE